MPVATHVMVRLRERRVRSSRAARGSRTEPTDARHPTRSRLWTAHGRAARENVSIAAGTAVNPNWFA